jgi:nucleoside-diphosphate-sugar epimerase
MPHLQRPLDPGIRTVLVTGATGFLGKAILAALRTRDLRVIAACRNPLRLPHDFSGDVRVGDLTDPDYRVALVEGVDAICHAGTWGAFWGHAEAERRLFLEPALDLLDKASEAEVKRFLLASTVAVAARPAAGKPVSDDAPLSKPGDDIQNEEDRSLTAPAGLEKPETSPEFEVIAKVRDKWLAHREANAA